MAKDALLELLELELSSPLLSPSSPPDLFLFFLLLFPFFLFLVVPSTFPSVIFMAFLESSFTPLPPSLIPFFPSVIPVCELSKLRHFLFFNGTLEAMVEEEEAFVSFSSFSSSFCSEVKKEGSPRSASLEDVNALELEAITISASVVGVMGVCTLRRSSCDPSSSSSSSSSSFPSLSAV